MKAQGQINCNGGKCGRCVILTFSDNLIKLSNHFLHELIHLRIRSLVKWNAKSTLPICCASPGGGGHSGCSTEAYAGTIKRPKLIVFPAIQKRELC